MSDITIVRDRFWRRLAAVTVQSFAAQWIFFVLPALYLAVNAILFMRLPSHGTAPILGLLLDLLSFALPVGIIFMLLLRFAQYALIEKPEFATRQFIGEIRELFVHPARLVNGLPIFAAMVLFNKGMVELKPVIPALNPFSWDETFMRLDRALSFGVDPWRILQPVLGHDIVTFALNFAYDFWFFALFGAWFWFGFRKEASVVRTQFFLGYMLAWWLGGGLLALVFSSAGPVYYGPIGLSPDPFAPLVSYLHDVNTRLPIWSVNTQQLLWDGYIGKTDPLGISAFPSMHNASAVLFAFAFWRISRPVGWFFIAYAAVIFLGSIHLAWHYAVDGYAGIAVAAVSWWLAGIAARWFHGLAATRNLNEGLASL